MAIWEPLKGPYGGQKWPKLGSYRLGLNRDEKVCSGTGLTFHELYLVLTRLDKTNCCPVFLDTGTIHFTGHKTDQQELPIIA